jgi:hypothetical protein
MRRTTLAVCAAIALLAWPSATDARTRRTSHARCPVVAHPLVANAQAEVYEANGRFERERFACAYASGHVYLLGTKPEYSPEGGGGVEQEALGGNMVAYEEIDEHITAPSSWVVFVRNLRTGRILHRLPSMGNFVSDLLVKADGSAAWIVDTRGLPTEDLVISVEGSSTHVLASGTGIGQESLALAGSTLYWTQNGQAASATLH